MRAPTSQLGTSPPLISSHHLPRASCRRGCQGAAAHREVPHASWCGPPLLQLAPPCASGGGLFARKFASFPRITRPTTHPPLPRRVPGRASTEPLCTRVAADACECRLCPDLATCVVARSQPGSWRARSCARVSGTAGEQDLHSRLPATMRSCATGALAPHPLAYSIHPPPSTTPFLKRVRVPFFPVCVPAS